MWPALRPLAPETASRASRIRMSVGLVPFSIRLKAVRAPEMPEPMMACLVVVGT